jgi:quercetin dioxygenase-like cupin family protein
MHKGVIKIGQIEVNFLLEPGDTNSQVSMFEFLVPAGAKVPMPHYHEAFDEIIYGLEGVMTFHIDGKPANIGPGDSAFIPKGVVHGFNNFEKSQAKALSVITPALLGPAYFIDLADIINTGGPPNIEKLKFVFEKHGLVPVINS